MRTVGIAAAWMMIGFGFGLLMRAIFVLGAPRAKEDYDE